MHTWHAAHKYAHTLFTYNPECHDKVVLHSEICLLHVKSPWVGPPEAPACLLLRWCISAHSALYQPCSQKPFFICPFSPPLLLCLFLRSEELKSLRRCTNVSVSVSFTGVRQTPDHSQSMFCKGTERGRISSLYIIQQHQKLFGYLKTHLIMSKLLLYMQHIQLYVLLWS